MWVISPECFGGADDILGREAEAIGLAVKLSRKEVKNESCSVAGADRAADESSLFGSL